jgi:hypothetical protein
MTRPKLNSQFGRRSEIVNANERTGLLPLAPFDFTVATPQNTGSPDVALFRRFADAETQDGSSTCTYLILFDDVL